MTLLGLVGLKDPSQPGFCRAMENCRNFCVKIKIITGDNIFTTRAIAMECEILKPDEDLSKLVVEGITFRNYTDEETIETIEMIGVMAKSFLFDKFLIM